MTGPSCQSAIASHSYLLGRKLELGERGDAMSAGLDDAIDVCDGSEGCVGAAWGKLWV